MRIFIDNEKLDWEEAWDICVRTFAYTNHTLLPEALERWPVAMLQHILPRHLQIIFEINSRHLKVVHYNYFSCYCCVCVGSWFTLAWRCWEATRFVNCWGRAREEDQYGQPCHCWVTQCQWSSSNTLWPTQEINVRRGGEGRERRACKYRWWDNLHCLLYTHSLPPLCYSFKLFYEMTPDKFQNKTNGITPRRWLRHCNPALADVISEVIHNVNLSYYYLMLPSLPLSPLPPPLSW